MRGCVHSSAFNMNMVKKNKVFYFEDTDPRSSNYKRILSYPQINRNRLFLKCFLPLVGLLILFVLLCQFCTSRTASILVFIITSIYIVLNLKHTLLSLIQLYQTLAPQRLRMKCRFEPSCSQYMILAIEKYGIIRGICKGIKRLSKCNNRGNGLRGGIDFP